VRNDVHIPLRVWNADPVPLQALLDLLIEIMLHCRVVLPGFPELGQQVKGAGAVAAYSHNGTGIQYTRVRTKLVRPATTVPTGQRSPPRTVPREE